VREKLFHLEGPPINDEQMQKLYQKYGVTDKNQVTPAMAAEAQQMINQERIVQQYETTKAEQFAKESAAQTIFEQETGAGGTGPIGRETTEAKIKAREAPIAPAERAKSGIPADFDTYMDIVKANKRLLSPADQRNVDRIESVRIIIASMQELAKQIFTSKGDYLSRVEHGAKLKYEQAVGSELGIAVQRYEDLRQTMVRTLLELAGEAGGRFTDKDMQQIMKAVPEIEGLIGDAIQIMPEGQKVATGKFDQLDVLLGRKLSFIKSPQMVTTTPPQEGGGKFKITKDGKLEKK
jgi:hypothetical protein